ncbi:MAG TPA: arylsulfatase [Opitutales bacterium]|nr:arylsulfatase [Opitutales bacterium]
MIKYLQITLLLTILPFVAADEKEQSASLAGSRPNIILVITDDQGMGDLSCMGHPFLETPHLDRFHAQSTRFTNYQASSTCSPTRAALMSGRHPFEVGITHTVFQRERMALDVVSLPETLKTAGYATGLFGKWHLGDEEAYLPQNRGFDEVLMHGAGGIGQYRWGDFKANTVNTYFDSTLLHNDTVVKTKGFCTDLFFNAGLAWIKGQLETEQPFFAYISTNAPHSPYIAPESYKKRFLEMGLSEKTAGFYGMVENIDDNFGRLMAKLEEWGALENTLVVFMTDNGSASRRIEYKDGKQEPAYNAGLRGYKASHHEGGTRVPSFWFWAGKIKAGADIDGLTNHYDVYPTLAALAGAELPDGPLPAKGMSFLPLLEAPQADWPERTRFFHRGRWDDGKWSRATREESQYHRGAVRTDRWRLVFELEDDEPVMHLADMLADPGETTNLVEQYPEVVQGLKQAYDDWWDSTEPFLVNEGLPKIPSEQQPFPQRYEQQLKTQGIPLWKPDEI